MNENKNYKISTSRHTTKALIRCPGYEVCGLEASCCQDVAGETHSAQEAY